MKEDASRQRNEDFVHDNTLTTIRIRSLDQPSLCGIDRLSSSNCFSLKTLNEVIYFGKLLRNEIYHMEFNCVYACLFVNLSSYIVDDVDENDTKVKLLLLS